MASKRKQITFLVTVSAPKRIETYRWPDTHRNVTAKEVAREVRTLVNNRSHYSDDFFDGDIKVRRIRLAKAGG